MADTAGKQEAQQRVDRIRAFRHELEQLTREGILFLSEDQRKILDEHHDKTLADLAGRFDVDVSESQKKISLAMRIASALGGLALCVAVFLFFYRYWGLLNTGSQIAILILTPVLLLIATEYTARREKTLYYTSLLAVVVFSAFVLNLNVLGSIFNLRPTPNAFLAWGIFAMVLGYGYRLRLELAAGLVCLVIFLAGSAVSLNGEFWGAMVERPETYLAGGLALLAVPLIFHHEKRTTFPQVYRFFGLAFVFLALLGLGNAGQLSYLPLAKKASESLYQVVGFGIAIASTWIGIRRRLPESVNLGAGFFAIYLFNRLFVWWWDWMPKYLFFLMIGAIALVLLAVFRKLRAGTARKEPA